MVGVEGPGGEPVEEGVNGGEDGRLEAGSLQNETEGKPVLVGDVAADAGQEVEAASSAASKHEEAGKGTAQSSVLSDLMSIDGTVFNSLSILNNIH
jgi:hypothetical protein